MNTSTFNQLPLFKDGIAQPIFPFTDGKPANYDATTSAIVRYCVYVESDYDMDGDGKRDLVKAFIQVPRSAALGHYKAATIFEARPYCAGVNADGYDHMKEVEAVDLPSFNLEDLDNEVAPRIPTGYMDTMEAASKAKVSDWYYADKGNEGTYCYENIDNFNYYLVRGFAVVVSAGFGTYGSDGFEYVGSHYERDAFKSVVEWLHGDRIAYTDHTGTVAIKADWSNGNVAMTGRSYAGTMPFAVAVTGVEGLKTIIPVAGIADWYSQQNMQGAQRYWPKEMLNSFLTYFCTSKYSDPTLTDEFKSKLDIFLNQMSYNQLKTGCDYSEFWHDGNYTLQADGIKCSALIVHGLHDENVSTKQFEMMLKSFQKAGANAKLLLHQGQHITPTMPNKSYGIVINGQFYDDIVNAWVSHYLYDIDNNAENMPALLVQNNIDQSKWETADAWETGKAITIESSDEGTITLDTDWEAAEITPENFDAQMSTKSSNMNQRFVTPELEQPVTIQGTVRVDFRAALVDGDADNNFNATNPNDADKLTFALTSASGKQDDIKLTVLLCDIAEEAFDNISTSDPERNVVPMKVVEKDGLPLGGELANIDIMEFETVHVPFNVITRAYIDLCNPASGYEPATSEESITLVKGEAHDYHAYLNATRYTIPAGHKLAIVIGTEDPINCLVHKDYKVELTSGSVAAVVPVTEDINNDLKLVNA